MSIERNREATAPQRESSGPQVTETSSVDRPFSPSPDMTREALGLHTTPNNLPEVEFITEKILEMGGIEGPTQFTNLLMQTIREAEKSPFHSGDKMKDVFMLLKLRQTSGSVLNGWT